MESPDSSGDQRRSVDQGLKAVQQVARRRVPPKIWWVTVRSGILPGWGQLANGKTFKAVLLGGIYGGWAAAALVAESDRREAQEALGDGSDPVLIARVNDAVDKRNFRMWMMGATMIYAMLDAYVDAHFYRYDENWRVEAGLCPQGSPAVALSVRF
jgi:hypothetical protein